MDLASLYSKKDVIKNESTLIEAEGISIYNGRLYLGIISKKDKITYNDIYLVEEF